MMLAVQNDQILPRCHRLASRWCGADNRRYFRWRLPGPPSGWYKGACTTKLSGWPSGPPPSGWTKGAEQSEGIRYASSGPPLDLHAVQNDQLGLRCHRARRSMTRCTRITECISAYHRLRRPDEGRMTTGLSFVIGPPPGWQKGAGTVCTPRIIGPAARMIHARHMTLPCQYDKDYGAADVQGFRSLRSSNEEFALT